MAGLAVAHADVLLRLGRLEQALELVERTTTLSDRRIQPWSDLAAAVLLCELGQDERARRPHRGAARLLRRRSPTSSSRSSRSGCTLLDGARPARRRPPTRRPPTRWRAPARSPSSAGGSSRAWCPGRASRSTAHLAAGARERARALLAELEAARRGAAEPLAGAP